jgi:hypothetical protein
MVLRILTASSVHELPMKTSEKNLGLYQIASSEHANPQKAKDGHIFYVQSSHLS